MPDAVRLQHALDQFGAGINAFPPVLRSYYHRLLTVDDPERQRALTPEEAFVLVRDLQRSLLTMAKVERGS